MSVNFTDDERNQIFEMAESWRSTFVYNIYKFYIENPILFKELIR